MKVPADIKSEKGNISLFKCFIVCFPGILLYLVLSCFFNIPYNILLLGGIIVAVIYFVLLVIISVLNK